MNIQARLARDALPTKNHSPVIVAATFNLFEEPDGFDAFINLRIPPNQAWHSPEIIQDFVNKLVNLEKDRSTRTAFFNCLNAKPLDASVLAKFVPEAEPASFEDIQRYCNDAEKHNPTLIVKVTKGKYILFHMTPANIPVPKDATEYVVFGKRTTSQEKYAAMKESFDDVSPESLHHLWLEFCKIAASGVKSDIKHVIVTP